MNKLSLFAAVVSLMMTTSVSAQQKLLLGQSYIDFTIKQMGVPLDGKFSKFEASVAFDAKKPEAGKISLSVDLSSAAVGDAETSNELRKPDWFNAAKFPMATFTSTAIRSTGPGRLDVAGVLTMKGTARPVVAQVTLTPGIGGITTAQGTFALKRNDFKIGEGDWTDVSIIANDVFVKFKLAVIGM